MFLKPGRINHPGLTAEQIRVRFNEMSLWDRKSIIDIARMIHSSIPGLALFTLDDGTFIEVSYAVTEHGDVEKINNIKIPAYADLDDHVIDFNVKDLY